MQAGPQLAVLLSLLLAASASSQTISQPPASLPVQSYSDDPLITGSAASAELCSLHSILGTESGAHGIGPLTIQPGCMSMSFQHHSTSSVNAQSLPSSGIATIFGSTSSGVSISSARPTTAPIVASSAASSAQSSAAVASSSSTAPPRQTNASNAQNKPPAAAGWIAKQNIGILLFTTFTLLAGVTFFLDELLAILV